MVDDVTFVSVTSSYRAISAEVTHQSHIRGVQDLTDGQVIGYPEGGVYLEEMKKIRKPSGSQNRISTAFACNT